MAYEHKYLDRTTRFSWRIFYMKCWQLIVTALRKSMGWHYDRIWNPWLVLNAVSQMSSPGLSKVFICIEISSTFLNHVTIIASHVLKQCSIHKSLYIAAFLRAYDVFHIFSRLFQDLKNGFYQWILNYVVWIIHYL